MMHTSKTRTPHGSSWSRRPAGPYDPRGVTWLKRLGAMVALVALMAGIAGSLDTPATSSATSRDVGSLRTSMVEMLDGENLGGLVSLTELREDVLGKYASLGQGDGVDVAVIDTGVAPVPGLQGDHVLHGPDLSMEATSNKAAYLDTYGHGTHMAGIIAGNRPGDLGIAPEARIVSVKVAGHDGKTTVPQVVAAIDWVVDHHDTDGLNIRVLNLSLGQAGIDTHVGDHLSAAVERAWHAGIFVVVAAGNGGEVQKHLDSPAIDPYVMAAGAVDSTDDYDKDERSVPSWSANGNGHRNPDMVAPGRSVASYRVPGSTIDQAVPSARVGDDLFRGSGTSQSAAATSGLAAALISSHPDLNPDQVKATIEQRSFGLEDEKEYKQGGGHIDGFDTLDLAPQWKAEQKYVAAAGGDSGIVSPTGATWSGGSWSKGNWTGATWSGATWSGGTWAGATWSGATWSGATWSGATWSGATWSGATWSGATWSGATWSGATWSGKGWS